MPVNSNVYRNIATTEFQKFVEIVNDSRFPAITTHPPDYNNQPTTQIFPKYAILTYDVGQNNGGIPTNTLPFGNNSSIDAFGRLRISNPDTIHNAKQVFDNAPLIFDSITVGTGSNTYDQTNSSTVMAVSSNNDVAIRQTKLSVNYQPGKSILAFITFVMESNTNCISRVGLFDGDTTTPYSNVNGFYFENNNNNLNFVINNYGGGQTSQTTPQSAWNIDKLDGTGVSGITLNVSKTQILVIDYEWLGVGRVRMGFCIDGIVYYAHAFNNANSLLLPYLKNPNNPVRYEIRSTGGAGSLRQICSSVMAEGGSTENGLPFSINSGSTSIGNFSAGVTAPLVNIRLKSTSRTASIRLVDFSAMASTTTNTLLQIVLNGTVSGTALTWNSIANSNMEYAICSTANSLSGGTVLYSGFFNKASNTVSTIPESILAIGASINGTSDVLSLCLTPSNGNESYYGSMNWIELL